VGTLLGRTYIIGSYDWIPASAGKTDKDWIPASAGKTDKGWVPAFAGMTDKRMRHLSN